MSQELLPENNQSYTDGVLIASRPSSKGFKHINHSGPHNNLV